MDFVKKARAFHLLENFRQMIAQCDIALNLEQLEYMDNQLETEQIYLMLHDDDEVANFYGAFRNYLMFVKEDMEWEDAVRGEKKNVVE